jgi:prophage regulatory protein
MSTAAGSPASYLIIDDDQPGAALLAASVRDILIRRAAVCEIVGLSAGTLYRLMSEGRFPRPFKITGTAVAWRLREVEAWVAARERGGAGAPRRPKSHPLEAADGAEIENEESAEN